MKGEKIIDLANNKIIINNQKSKINYLYNLNDGLSALNINTIFNQSYPRYANGFQGARKKSTIISKIVFHPLEKIKLLIEANNLIYALDIDKLKIEEIKLQISNEKNRTNKLSNWLTKNS